MRALIAIVVIALAIAIVFLVVRFIPPQQPAPLPPPARPVAPAQPPAKVVVSYLGTLYHKDYRTAYKFLSAASQKAHPFDEFVKLNEEKGITQFDLSTAKEETGPAKQAVVTLSLKEDVSQHSLHLTQEAGQWRIVFLKGTPSFPYAE